MSLPPEPDPALSAEPLDDEGALWPARIHRFEESRLRPDDDLLVVEEPIEFHIRNTPVATVMRTPGADLDLAHGFFFGEGWIEGPAEVEHLEITRTKARRDDSGKYTPPNLARLTPTWRDREISTRPGPVASSCGVCGKRTIEEVLRTLPPVPAGEASREAVTEARTILTLPDRMRERQALFDRTGALHAAAIFDPSGQLLTLREDIGRHNAVDKAIGHHVARDPAELEGQLLAVSGRVSFEIVQKALRARLLVVVSVSGVSSLAVELARCGGLTVCGFTRGKTFSVYTHPSRLREG